MSTERKEVMILLYEYLKSNYMLGEPIFQNDIKINGMTDANLRDYFKKLTDDGVICRFDDEIYYFPKTNILGEKQELAVETVAIHKYIMRKGKRIGYYSGYTLANRMGLTHQVPFIEEITSKLASGSDQETIIKNRKYIVRKPVVEITDENVMVLQFLDCLKDIEKFADEEMEICGQILTKYAREHAITKQDIDRFISKYPMKIYKTINDAGIHLFDSELND